MALLVLFAASIYTLYFFYHKPTIIEKSIPIYRYRQKGELAYLVKLKPNNIFEEPILGPGKTYFTKLIDQINISFNYRFNGDKAASLKGAYNIIATVESPEMWRKDFFLVPQTRLTTEGKTLTFNKDFSVNLAPFQEFLKIINEESGVSAREPKLIIKANVYLKADLKEGTASESLAPTMIIPLTSGEFKIEGENSIQKSGSLSKTFVVTDPTVKKERTFALIPAPVLGLLLILFFFFTENKLVEVDERKKVIDLIWKKYGERLVKVREEVLPVEKLNIVPLNSLEDLVKVADELGKPIIYQEKANPGDFPVLYVFESSIAFKYQL